LKTQNKHIDQTIPFLQLFIDDIEDTRVEMLHESKLLYRKMLIYGIGFLAVGATYFLSIGSVFFVPMLTNAAAIILAATMLYPMRKAYLDRQKLQKTFEQTLQKELYSIVTSSIQPHWYYDSNHELTKKDLMASDIFNDYISLDYIDFCIRGKHDSHPLEIFKIGATMKQDDHTNIKDSFEGLFIQITLDQKIYNRSIIAPHTTHQNINTRSLHKLNFHQKGYDLHSDAELTFSRYFRIYKGEYGVPAFLTPSIQRQLAHFVINDKKQIYLSFQKNKLYISIKTNEIIKLPSLKGEVAAKTAVEQFYGELKIAIDLLERLKVKG
jgi:hypothetical protein